MRKVLGADGHPSASLLNRYAANDLGRGAKDQVGKHVEICDECRGATQDLRRHQRRMREFESLAISRFVSGRAC